MLAPSPHGRAAAAACRDLRVWCTAGRGAALLATGLLGCIFTVPPPLPEELAELEASERARAGGANGGEVSEADPEADPAQNVTAGNPDASEDPADYAKGDPPLGGMSPAQMRAYATAQGDPEEGDFTLDEALDGLEEAGTLTAIFHTNAGEMTCELFETLAPGTVANFVGLARGLRPARDADGAWVAKPYFDGVVFHRVIPGFMIQGGDPTGTGHGEVGYVIPDEFSDALRHDRAGILSMANIGPGTGTTQFFITLGPTPHLDDKHAIFGACDDAAVDVAEHIAAKRGPGDRPTDPQVIERLEITRR